MKEPDPKHAQPSRSGEEGREKERRRASGHRPRGRRQRLAAELLALAETALAHASLTADEATACRTTLDAALSLLPERALALTQRNTAGFRWYATIEAVDEAYRAITGSTAEGIWQAFYNTSDRSIHLCAQHGIGTHLHEIAHAIDGPGFEFTGTAAWRAAYNVERGRLSGEAYPTTNPQEWWATLAVIVLARPIDWRYVKPRLPRSARIVERVFDV